MSTRLGRYCDRVIEAGWLAAVILTPLFFNVYSSRVFEPDKLTLLRSVAVLMAVAWLVRSIEELQVGTKAGHGPGVAGSLGEAWRSFARTPLVPVVLLLVLVYLVATALSVAPHTSLWGSYQRLQGTYTMLAYIVVFFTTWQGMRTREQLERLLNVIVLASLPVALYGVLQHYGLDPLPWAGSVTERVTANLGNAIFIAAYLIMAFFITLERAVTRFRRLLSEESGTVDGLAGGVYLFVLALQGLAIYFSKSRGPWLGLLGGIYVFALISLVALRRTARECKDSWRTTAGKAAAFSVLSIPVGVAPAYVALLVSKRGRRWLWLSLCIQSVLVAAFLAVFNLPNSPLAPLRQVPGIGRLGQIFETETGTGRVRVLIWQGAVEMLRSDPARALVGYGPESMYVAYNRFYPPDLAHYESRNASPDRSHNETFDALVTTGIVGFAVYIALFVSIFYHGLRWLGFLPDRKPGGGPTPRAIFLALTIGGAVLGAIVPFVLDGSLRFAGVGVPAGLITGVALYLAASSFGDPGAAEAPARFGQRELLLAGLLAMIVAHFVEIHFGIAIAATRLYYWLGLALLLVVGSGRLATEPAPAALVWPATVALESRRRKRRRYESRHIAPPSERPAGRLSGAVAAGFVGALVLGVLFFDFTTNTAGDANLVRVIWESLTLLRPPGQPATPSPGILAMVLLTWLLGAILVAGEAEAAPEPPGGAWWAAAMGWYLSISLLVALVFALGQASLLRDGEDLGRIVFFLYAFICGMILLAAAFLPGQRLAGGRAWQPGWAWLYGFAILAAGVLVYGNVSVVRADVYYKQAWDGYHKMAFESLNARRMDVSTALRYYQRALDYYGRAIAQAPAEDYYRLFRGKAYLEMAEFGPRDAAESFLARAEEDLLLARRLNPLNTDHTANLARLYRSWAAVTGNAAIRQEMLDRSVRYYAEATKLSPHNAILFNEWGRTLLELGQPEQALARYQESLALDSQFANTYMLLGEYHAGRKETAEAIRYYRQAAALDPGSAAVHSLLGQLYAESGRNAEAISENVQVLTLLPNDYVTHKNLAILYDQAGQPNKALAEATIARQLAPESDWGTLDQFIAQLRAALGQEATP